MLNTQELQKITEEAGLSNRYLFSYVGVKQNEKYDNIEIISAIEKFRKKSKGRIHNNTDASLAKILKKISDVQPLTPIAKNNSTIMITVEELAKQLKIPSGSTYWYFRNTDCEQRTSGIKKYGIETIKNTLSEVLKGKTKYRKKLQNFIDNPNDYCSTNIQRQDQDQDQIKQTNETSLDYLKSIDNSLKELLSIWRS